MAPVQTSAHGGFAANALARLASRPCRTGLLIFALSLSLHGCWLSRAPTHWVQPTTQWELPAIAISLATTGRFADPYALPTGPTAHLPPVQPALHGAIYSLLGVTLGAGYIVLLIEMATSAALWALLPWLATRAGLHGPAGVLAGFAGSLMPRWPGHGEALAGLALCLLTAGFARRWSSARNTVSGSVLLGMAAGAAFHVQPALLTVVVAWMVFEARWARGRRSRRLLVWLAVGIVLACVPWAWRNYRAFDAVFFIRSNFGLELRMGNHEGAEAAMEVMDVKGEHLLPHPRTHDDEARNVQVLGEVGYMRAAGREAWRWIETHPAAFARLTATRIACWWLGPLYEPRAAILVAVLTLMAWLGAWLAFPDMSPPQRAVLLLPALAYPLVYYVVAYMPRYRQPVDWIFLLAAGEAVWRWVDRRPTSATLPSTPPGSRARSRAR